MVSCRCTVTMKRRESTGALSRLLRHVYGVVVNAAPRGAYIPVWDLLHWRVPFRISAAVGARVASISPAGPAVGLGEGARRQYGADYGS
jgi:hypothetical protein